MIDIIKKEACCGCSACMQICPKKCINMIEDTEGFLYPIVDSSKCIQCNLCEKICPIQNIRSESNERQNAYVAYIKNEELRLKSSSGGMFTLFAEAILKENGVIYGAAFDNEFLVHHVGIDNNEDLQQLRGSKYLQSRIENTFIEVKELLKLDRFVLYVGTACQVAGLKAYLGKEYEKLYTIDVLCHGVPSPKLWKVYLQYQEQQHSSEIKKMFFRDKKWGWKGFNMALLFNNQQTYEKTFRDDYFMRLFLQDICLRPSCHECQFKELNRPSDITLGDCWGIENYMPQMDDDKGTSVVLIHSDKGQKLFDSLKEKMICCEAEIDKALPATADSRKSVKRHPKRKIFFKQLEQGKDIKQLIKLIEPSLIERLKRKIKNIIKRISIVLKTNK